jgi:hypothetical protein
MKQKEKLIELLSLYFNIGDSYSYNLTRTKSAFGMGTMSLSDFEEFDDETISDLADCILEDGWIKPPCKVGDTVYYIAGQKIYKAICHAITLQPSLQIHLYDYDGDNARYSTKDVFSTPEEAEKTLKARIKKGK